jgi:hypothetical protein
MAGEIASLALSRMTVPVLYFIVNRRKKQGKPGQPAPETEMQQVPG